MNNLFGFGNFKKQNPQILAKLRANLHDFQCSESCLEMLSRNSDKCFFNIQAENTTRVVIT